MTFRLSDTETEVLRRAVREHVENHGRAELLDRVLDEELPRHAGALRRLGRSTSLRPTCGMSPSAPWR